MATSTERFLTHQPADAESKRSEINIPETQSSAIFPLAAIHLIDSAASSAESIEYEHRANAIRPVAEQSVEPINVIVPGAATRSVSGASSTKALKELQARCKKLKEELAKKD